MPRKLKELKTLQNDKPLNCSVFFSILNLLRSSEANVNFWNEFQVDNRCVCVSNKKNVDEIRAGTLNVTRSYFHLVSLQKSTHRMKIKYKPIKKKKNPVRKILNNWYMIGMQVDCECANKPKGRIGFQKKKSKQTNKRFVHSANPFPKMLFTTWEFIWLELCTGRKTIFLFR